MRFRLRSTLVGDVDGEMAGGSGVVAEASAFLLRVDLRRGDAILTKVSIGMGGALRSARQIILRTNRMLTMAIAGAAMVSKWRCVGKRIVADAARRKWIRLMCGFRNATREMAKKNTRPKWRARMRK